MRILILFGALLLASCGYRFDGPRYSSERPTISIPYVEGDLGGQLTDELIRQIAASGFFEYRKEGGQLLLKVKVLSNNFQKIGYRFDRDDTTGHLRKNLFAAEERDTMAVEVTLMRAYSDEVLVGPATVQASAEYDYVDSSSLQDLSFINSFGKRVTVINFSLGQLDTVEGAEDDAATPLFKHLAQKIVDGIIHVQ